MRSNSTATASPPGSTKEPSSYLPVPGLDWTAKYPATAAALATLKVKSAYLDGELCGVRPDGVTSFELMQQASDRGGAGLVYFVFDLLELDGKNLAALPLLDRKTRLAALLEKPPDGIAFSAHETCDGEAFRRAACRHGLEGVVSKRVDRRYLPDDRSAWIKCKCLNRGEFVIAGWSDPEGSRPFLGSLLLAYYDDAGRLLYAGGSEPACRSVNDHRNGTPDLHGIGALTHF